VFGRVADTARLKDRFGFQPAFTTRQALEEFVSGQKFQRLVTPERAEAWQQDVYDFLRRKRDEAATGGRRR